MGILLGHQTLSKTLGALLGEVKNDERWDILVSTDIKGVEAKEGKNGKDDIKLSVEEGGVKLKRKEGSDNLSRELKKLDSLVNYGGKKA